MHSVGLSLRVSYVRVAVYTSKYLTPGYLFGRTTHGVAPQVRLHGLEIVYYEKDSIRVDVTEVINYKVDQSMLQIFHLCFPLKVKIKGTLMQILKSANIFVFI